MDQGEATGKHKPWCGIHHNQAATTTCDCDNRAAMAGYAFGYAESEIERRAAINDCERTEAHVAAAIARASEAEDRLATIRNLLAESHRHTANVIEALS